MEEGRAGQGGPCWGADCPLGGMDQAWRVLDQERQDLVCILETTLDVGEWITEARGGGRETTPGGQGPGWRSTRAAGPVERALSWDSRTLPWLLVLTASFTAMRPGADDCPSVNLSVFICKMGTRTAAQLPSLGFSEG